MGLLRSSSLFFRKTQRSKADSDDLRSTEQEPETSASPVASPRTEVARRGDPEDLVSSQQGRPTLDSDSNEPGTSAFDEADALFGRRTGAPESKVIELDEEAGQGGDPDDLNSSQQGRPTLDTDSNEQATSAFDEADALFGRRTGAPESEVIELDAEAGLGIAETNGIVASADKFTTDDSFGAEKEPERFGRGGSAEPVAQETGDGVADQMPALMDEMTDDYDEVPVTSGIEGEIDGLEPEQPPHELTTAGLDDLGDDTAEALLPIEDADASFDV